MTPTDTAVKIRFAGVLTSGILRRRASERKRFVENEIRFAWIWRVTSARNYLRNQPKHLDITWAQRTPRTLK